MFKPDLINVCTLERKERRNIKKKRKKNNRKPCALLAHLSREDLIGTRMNIRNYRVKLLNTIPRHEVFEIATTGLIR